MTLATRVIPVVLKRGDAMVKGKQFQSWRSVGHAMQACAIHAARCVDELMLLDIGATPENRSPDFAAVGRLTASLFSPLTVGGGVRTVEHVQELLRSGADKVSICTGAIASPTLVSDVAKRFGSQAMVVAIDVQGGRQGRVRTLGAGPGPVGWAKSLEMVGCGEILLTSIDRDGMMEGYDLELIRAVSEAVDIPVIAAGGAGSYQHMLEAVQAGASAVAASSMFLFTDQTPAGAAAYLAAHGVVTRQRATA